MDVAEFERFGFATVPEVLTPLEVDELLTACAPTTQDQPIHRKAGIRNLLSEVPAVTTVAHSRAIRELVCPVLGSQAFPVRALLFDKTPEANWKVPWHQDLAIAVTERIETPGFTGWSIKDGVHHVHPPAGILKQMVTVRLHLDDCGPDHGPLRVLPGSHRAGKLAAAAIMAWKDRTSAVTCLTSRGGTLVMRPLLLHASSPARVPSHRRVLHLEFAATGLPGELRWALAQASPGSDGERRRPEVRCCEASHPGRV